MKSFEETVYKYQEKEGKKGSDWQNALTGQQLQSATGSMLRGKFADYFFCSLNYTNK